MKNNLLKASICTFLIASLMILTVSAKGSSTELPKESSTGKTEAAVSTETDTQTQPQWKVETELEEGVYTIRILSNGKDKTGYGWQNYTGDKGDATFIELITQTDEEKGYAYAGSFKATDDCKDQGDLEDTIRLVHTDGVVTDEYMEFTLSIKDGKISEAVGGSNCMPTSDDEFSSVLCGTWKEKDKGAISLEISQNPEEGFDCILTGDKDAAATTPYTFTARHDCIQEAFLYDEGKCLFALDASADDPEEIILYLHDNSHTGGSDLTFVKAD